MSSDSRSTFAGLIANLSSTTNRACTTSHQGYRDCLIKTCPSFFLKFQSFVLLNFTDPAVQHPVETCRKDPTYGKAFDLLYTPLLDVLGALYDVADVVSNYPLAVPPAFLETWMSQGYHDYVNWVKEQLPIDLWTGSTPVNKGEAFVGALDSYLRDWNHFFEYQGKTMCGVHAEIVKALPGSPPVMDCSNCAPTATCSPDKMPCSPESQNLSHPNSLSSTDKPTFTQLVADLSASTNSACTTSHQSYTACMNISCPTFYGNLDMMVTSNFIDPSIPNQNEACRNDPTYGKAYDILYTPFINVLTALYAIEDVVANDPIDVPPQFLTAWMDNDYGAYVKWVKGQFPINTTTGSCPDGSGITFITNLSQYLWGWNQYIQYNGKTMCAINAEIVKALPGVTPVIDCSACWSTNVCYPDKMPCKPETP